MCLCVCAAHYELWTQHVSIVYMIKYLNCDSMVATYAHGAIVLGSNKNQFSEMKKNAQRKGTTTAVSVHSQTHSCHLLREETNDKLCSRLEVFYECFISYSL